MKKVFIVDDDNMYQMILKYQMLKVNKELYVQSFANGRPAMELLTQLPDTELPDIILLDINMPTMDGWQFLAACEQLPEERLNRSVIYMISSSLDTRDKERALASRFVKEYICKPVTAEQLAQMLS